MVHKYAYVCVCKCAGVFGGLLVCLGENRRRTSGGDVALKRFVLRSLVAEIQICAVHGLTTFSF